MAIIFLLPWLEEPENFDSCTEKCCPPTAVSCVDLYMYTTAACTAVVGFWRTFTRISIKNSEYSCTAVNSYCQNSTLSTMIFFLCFASVE